MCLMLFLEQAWYMGSQSLLLLRLLLLPTLCMLPERRSKQTHG
jgi:hypothetical protein